VEGDDRMTHADPQRDLNPHRPAVAAMWLYHDRYSKGGLGSMGFWDSLAPSEQRTCRDMVQDICKARLEIKI
jgi:hypothetical protein